MGWASVVNGGLKFLENLKCGKSDGLIHHGIYLKTTSDGGDRMWGFEATTKNDNPSEYFLSLKLLTAKYRSFDKIQEDDSQRQSFGLEPGRAPKAGMFYDIIHGPGQESTVCCERICLFRRSHGKPPNHSNQSLRTPRY